MNKFTTFFISACFAFSSAVSWAEGKEKPQIDELIFDDLAIVMSLLTEQVLVDRKMVTNSRIHYSGEQILKDGLEQQPIQGKTGNLHVHRSPLVDRSKDRDEKHIASRRIKNLHTLYQQAQSHLISCRNLKDKIVKPEREGEIIPENEGNLTSAKLDRFLNFYLYKTTVVDKSAKGFMTQQMRRYLYLEPNFNKRSEFTCESNLRSIFPYIISGKTGNPSGLSIFDAEGELIIKEYLIGDESHFIGKKTYENPCVVIKELSQCLTELDEPSSRRILERRAATAYRDSDDYRGLNFTLPGWGRHDLPKYDYDPQK